MDPSKKTALLKWIDALGKNKIQSFEDLRDGRHIISVLQSYDHLIDHEAVLETTEQRYHVIQQYLEGFYNQPLVETKVLDFGGIVHTKLRGDLYDLEMGKLLLVLLGGLIQDNVCRDKTIQPAFSLDECTQNEIKEMMELTLLMDSPIPQHIEDMLKSKTVAEGGGLPASPKSTPGTPIAVAPAKHPSSSCNGPVFAMYSNSPQPGNSAGISIREISSPLRVMSLSSPITPLGALMSSPQLAQKAMLRQKKQEVKRLELALQSEQHVRSEFELDLQEARRLIKEKDVRIQECERQFSDLRRLRDQLDEQELLLSEKDKLSRDVSKLQARVVELQDVRQHNVMLEQESRDGLVELDRAREELKLLESVKKSSEEFRAKCHKLQLEVGEYEASQRHAQGELEAQRVSLAEVRAMYETAQYNCNTLRREKDELEEMMGATANGMIQTPFAGGESMNVVVEKQMSELQVEYDHMKASWVDPAEFSDVKQRLELEAEAKKTYQEKYLEMKKQCMSVEGEVATLATSVDLYRNSVAQLEVGQREAQTTIHDLRAQVSQQQEREDVLRRSESDLEAARGQLEARVHALEKEVSQCNTELQLTRREIEVHMDESENRRQTILKLDSTNQEKVAAEHRLSTEVTNWRHKAENMGEQLRSLKEEWQQKEATLNTKLQSTQETLCQTESILENERIERDNKVKGLNEKLTRLEVDCKELIETLEKEKRLFRQKLAEMENKIKIEKNLSQERLDSLNSVKKDFEEHKELCSCREESLTQEVNSLRKEKKSAEFECHKLKLEHQSASESFSNKYQKLEGKLAVCEAAYKQEVMYMNACNEEKDQTNKCLKSEICDLHRTIENQKANIVSINKVVDQFKTENRDLADGLENSNLKVVDMELQLNNLGEKYAQEIEKNTSLQNEIKSLLSKSDALKKDSESKMSDLEQSLAETNSQFEKFRGEHEAMVRDNDSKMATVQANLATLRESEMMLTSSLTVCQADYSTMQHMIQEKEAEKTQTDQLLRDHDDRIALLEANLNSEMESLDRAKSEMQSLSAQHEAAVSSLKCAHEQEVLMVTSESRSRQQALEGTIHELETVLQSKSENLVELEGRCEIFAADMDSIVARLSGEIDSLNANVSESKAVIDHSKQTVQDLEAHVKQNDQLLRDRDDRIALLEANLTSETESLDRAKLEMQSLAEQHEAAVSSLKCAHELEMIKFSSESQSRQLEAVEAQQALEGTIHELETVLQSKSENLVELEGRCEIIAADKDSIVARLSGEIDSLNANVSESKAVIDHSKQTIQYLEAHVKHLDECKLNLEAELELCKTAVSSLKCEHELEMIKFATESRSRQLEAVKAEQALEGTIHELETVLQSKSENLVELEGRCEIIAGDTDSIVARLSGEIDSLNANVSESKAVIDHSKQTIQDLEAHVKQTDQLLRDRDDRIALLEANLNSEMESLDRAKLEMQSLSAQHEAAVSSLKCAHEQEVLMVTSESQSRQQALEGTIHELETVLQSKSENLVELEGRCEIIAGDTDSIVARLSGEIDSLNANVSESKAVIDNSKQTIQDLEVHVKHLDECKLNLEAELELCKTAVSSLKCEHELEMIKFATESRSRQLEAVKAEQALEGTIHELETVLQSKSENLVELEGRCEIIAADTDSIVARLSGEIDSLNANVSESKAVIDHSKQTIQDLEVHVKHLDQCKLNLEAELELCKTKLISVKSQLESQVGNLIQNQDELNCKLNVCRSEFAAQKEGFEQQIEQLTLSKVELEHSLETCKSNAVSELEEITDKLLCTEQHLQSRCDQLNADAAKQQAHLNEVTLSLQSKTEECVSLNKKCEVLVGDNHKVMADMSGEIDSLTANLKEKNELITKAEQTIQDLQAELAACKAELKCVATQLQSQVRNLMQHHDELNSKLNLCTSELAEQKSDFDQQVEELRLAKVAVEQSLETCKSEAEAEVTELRDKLVETEHYWRCQCEQLEEEYNKGTEEQRLEYHEQMASSESEFTSKLQDVMDEKDLYIANQQQAYQERAQGFEKALAEKRQEIEAANKELQCQRLAMEELEGNSKRQLVCVGEQLASVGEQLASVSDRLDSESGQHRKSIAECDMLKQKVEEVEESKKIAVEMLIGQYETQLDCLKSNEVDVQKLSEEHKTEKGQLETAMEGQKCTYQTLISSLEEKLNSETCDLKERLSQMKCQYDTIIENNGKETRTQLREYEAKCHSLQQANSSSQETLSEKKEENIQLQSDLVMCSNKNSELVETVTSCNARLAESATTVTSLEERVSSLAAELTTAQEEGRGLREELGKEKGERTEMERQLAYLRDQTDTLTAELSSQQQQLAAVEEEKRVVEVERLGLVQQYEAATEETRLRADKERHFADVEKLEVERQLQSLQKCYDTVQRSMTESEHRAAQLECERGQMSERCHELETRIHVHMEREAKMTADHLHHMNKAAELNSKLRNQLDEKCREYTDANANFNKQLEAFQREAEETKRKLESDLRIMVEEKTALEIDVATLQQVRAKLKTTEAERQKLQEINEKYNIHYHKKKETIVELSSELTETKKLAEAATRCEQKMAKEIAPLHAKLDAERIKTKTLTAKIRTLEVQNDLADRKLREYRAQLDKGNSVFLGDNSHFMAMIMEKQNASDASFMENHPSSVPLDDSLDDTVKHRYDLRNRRSSYTGSVDETMTPGTRASRSRNKLSKSASTATVIRFKRRKTNKSCNGMTPGAASIGSSSSLAHRLRFRESVSSLDKSVSSVDSCRSNASNVPRGTGGLFHCDDEPMEFEWGRLGELQRRNTLCPSHMKTSYPVETQSCKPTKFSEYALRESTMKMNQSPTAPGSGRKRKTNWDSTDSSSDSSDSKKLAKGTVSGTVYQKPGPPTPANCRRNSGKGTSKSPSKRNSCIGSRSPRTPMGLRGKTRTPRRTPRTSARDAENIGSGKKANSRESISFSIGFSPKASSKRLRRQDGFIQKQPQSSSQTRKPLGTRNFQQTGV